MSFPHCPLEDSRSGSPAVQPHAEDVAAYRPSPLAHYGQLKGLPKIIPLFQPKLQDPLAGEKLADVTGTIHLELTRPIMGINTQSIPGRRDEEYIRYFALCLRNIRIRLEF